MLKAAASELIARWFFPQRVLWSCLENRTMKKVKGEGKGGRNQTAKSL